MKENGNIRSHAFTNSAHTLTEISHCHHFIHKGHYTLRKVIIICYFSFSFHSVEEKKNVQPLNKARTKHSKLLPLNYITFFRLFMFYVCMLLYEVCTYFVFNFISFGVVNTGAKSKRRRRKNANHQFTYIIFSVFFYAFY